MNIWSDIMDFNYFLEMNNNEKAFLLIIVILILIIILTCLKLKTKTKTEIELNKLIGKKEELPISIATEKPESSPQEQIEIDAVLNQMRDNLEEPIKDKVEDFEDEQEKQSIISYQELVKANEKEELTESNKPYYGDDTESKFKTSEFISPIYGRVDNKIEYPTIPKIRRAKLDDNEERLETGIESVSDKEILSSIKPEAITPKVTLEKKEDNNRLNEERLKNEKFLKELKDFRRKLE